MVFDVEIARRALDAINSLEQMPARCALAPESEDVGVEVRVLLFGKHPHVYKIFSSLQSRTEDRGAVRVFHVRHGEGWKPASLNNSYKKAKPGNHPEPRAAEAQPGLGLTAHNPQPTTHNLA